MLLLICFCKLGLSKLGSILCKIWVPTWLHVACQNQPTTFQKTDLMRHQHFDRVLLQCFLDLGSVLGANLEPCWPFFRFKNGAGLRAVGGCCCWVYVLFRFLGRPDPVLALVGLDLGGFGPHLGSSLEVFGLILAPFWCQVGAMLGPSDARDGHGWAGGVTRIAKNNLLWTCN